jgi:hypothetical protein
MNSEEKGHLQSGYWDSNKKVNLENLLKIVWYGEIIQYFYRKIVWRAHFEKYS